MHILNTERVFNMNFDFISTSIPQGAVQLLGYISLGVI